MKFFFKRKDGGPESHVTGYWLIEWKKVFSIVLLRFDRGSREVFHSHAFNALTWFLSGEVEECVRVGRYLGYTKIWGPSFKPKWTPRDCVHKVYGRAPRTWALSIRGPWSEFWREYNADNTFTVLTNGRKIVSEDK